MTKYSPELKEAVRVDLVDNQMDYEEVSKKHGVPYNLLLTWTRRKNWLTKAKTKKVIAKVGAEVDDQAVHTIAKSLLARGQAHADKVFSKASLACEKAKVRPPVNWKDFEIADRVARRAAGLNDDRPELSASLLVHINEAGDDEITPVKSQPTHADLVETDTPHPSLPLLTEQAS